jgi:hypothetical protein
MLLSRAVTICLLLASTLPAQNDLQRLLHPPERRFDLATTLQALQQDVRDTADDARTVAGASWQMLAFLASGSTLRSGPHREELKSLSKWLHGAQAEDGWHTAGGERCARPDQALVAYATCNAGTLSTYPPVLRRAQQASRALLVAFARPAAAPATAEEAALLALLAQAQQLAGQDAVLTTQLQQLAHRQTGPLVFGQTRRADAALHLAQQLLGRDHGADLTAARTWPAELAADPLHAWFAVCALAPHREQLLQRAESFERLASAREQPAGAVWPAAADCDQGTTTALLATVLATANAWLPSK